MAALRAIDVLTRGYVPRTGNFRGLAVARIVEFPGCVAVGLTQEQALFRLGIIAVAWVEWKLEKGEAIPPPQKP